MSRMAHSPAGPRRRGLPSLLAVMLLATPALAGERPDVRTVAGADGTAIALLPPKGGATAVVFLSADCPISNAYSPTLNALAEAFAAPGFRLVGVTVDPDLDPAGVLAHAKEFCLAFAQGVDPKGELARKLGVTVTPEAVVIDDAGAVRYRGRVDDQFAGRGLRNAASQSHELRDAVAAVLAGRAVAAAHVPAVGCPLPEPAKAAAAAPPTYTKDVAAILQNHCLDCHRTGQVGPFSLGTYAQAKKRAADIATVVSERAMPPWKPVPGVGPKFKHDKALSKAEIEAVSSWAAAGAPEGDPADLPPPRTFHDGWALGTPDLVIEPAEDFAIPASGEDIYRCFVIPTDLPGDVGIAAIEYRPGNRKVVHHVLSYVDVSGEARKKDAADPGQGYSCFAGPEVEVHGDLGGWAPGNDPNYLPEGVGRIMPRKADVIMQVHYHPSGKAETDRTRIGLYFSKVPIRQALHWAAAADFGLKLPAGAAGVEAKGAWPAPVDLVAYAVTPHMHMLGKDIRMALTSPDGTKRDLIAIADWDFGWQNTYYFEAPIDVPKGSVLSFVSHFDNSSANPRNPHHPPKEITWGEATTDEMAIGFLAVTKKGQDLTVPGQRDDLQEIFRDQREEFIRTQKAEAARRGGGSPTARPEAGSR